MKSRMCVYLRAVAAVCVLTMLATWTTWAASEREIQGVYKVADTTETGDQVQFKIQMRLFNRTDNQVSIEKVSFPDISQSNSSAVASPVEIAARNHTDVTISLTATRAEYEQLKKGMRLWIGVSFKGANGQVKNQAIDLMRFDGMVTE